MPDASLPSLDAKSADELCSLLVTSEYEYCDSLYILVENFMKPMQQQQIISSSDVKAVFSNLSKIQIFADSLYEQLNLSFSMSFEHLCADLASIVQQNIKGFQLYCEYTQNHQSNSSSITQVLQNAQVINFVQQQQQLTGRDFVQLLAAPVTRLAQYVTLFNAISAAWPQSQRELANAIAQLIQATERAGPTSSSGTGHRMVSQLQTRLFKDSVDLCSADAAAGERAVVKYGRQALLLQSVATQEYTWKPIILCLFNDCILYGWASKDKGTHHSPEYKCKAVVRLDRHMQVEAMAQAVQEASYAHLDLRYAFRMNCPTLSDFVPFIVQCASEAEMHLWMTSIADTVRKFNSNKAEQQCPRTEFEERIMKKSSQQTQPTQQRTPQTQLRAFQQQQQPQQHPQQQQQPQPPSSFRGNFQTSRQAQSLHPQPPPLAPALPRFVQTPDGNLVSHSAPSPPPMSVSDAHMRAQADADAQAQADAEAQAEADAQAEAEAAAERARSISAEQRQEVLQEALAESLDKYRQLVHNPEDDEGDAPPEDDEWREDD